MTPQMIVPLAKTTLSAPAAAAEQLLGFQLSRDVLWTALALVSVFNTVLMVILFNLAPAPAAGSDMPQIPTLFFNPLPLFVMQTGVLVVFVHALYWTGKTMGGTGGLGDILTVTIWFSAMSAAIRAATLVLMLALPVVAQLFSIVASIWSIWVLLHFIRVGLRLPGIGSAIATLVVGSVSMAVGLALILAVIIVLAQGVIGGA